jgi:hypothetical protein
MRHSPCGEYDFQVLESLGFYGKIVCSDYLWVQVGKRPNLILPTLSINVADHVGLIAKKGNLLLHVKFDDVLNRNKFQLRR